MTCWDSSNSVSLRDFISRRAMCIDCYAVTARTVEFACAGANKRAKDLRRERGSATWNSAEITASASAPASTSSPAFSGVMPPMATSGTRARALRAEDPAVRARRLV